MARDSLDMSGSESDSSSILDSIPDGGSVRLASTFNGPTIHLLWRQNSHKFEDRIIPLNESVKVGRSVAKLKPTPHNAIFDCKVLSRNHALIWFENGRFYIQDTRSSNGTFVNNDRLSKGSEESIRKEIYSGDILQFGVDVLENQKKVTHGCIIALAKMYLADGTELKADSSSVTQPFSVLSCGQSCTLLQSLLGAEQREVVLKEKIVALKAVIEEIHQAAETSWQALIGEEKLLNKIETLERQLAALGESNHNAEIARLISEKEVYEVLAKESLSKVLQDKLMALRKCDELQYLHKTATDQLNEMQHSKEKLELNMNELAEKVDSVTEEAKSQLDKHQLERTALQEKVTELEEESGKLQQTITGLQEELEKSKLEARRKLESPLSEKGLIIENAASEAEDKISLDSFQGETKSNKEEIIRLEETVSQLKERQSKLEAEKEDLLTEISDLKNFVERSRADLSEKTQLSVQLQVMQNENTRLEAELEKSQQTVKRLEDSMNNQLITTKPALLATASSGGDEKQHSTKQIRSLQAELSLIKERFKKCQDEKLEMRKEFEELAKEYSGFARQFSTACKSAMVPLIVLCVAILLVSQPFYYVFGGSTKSEV